MALMAERGYTRVSTSPSAGTSVPRVAHRNGPAVAAFDAGSARHFYNNRIFHAQIVAVQPVGMILARG